MSQIDPRTLELINAELDDELNPSLRAELETLLAADPAARRQRDQFQRMAQSLSALPVVDPPSGLRQRWAGGPATPTVSTLPARRGRRWFAPAMAIAASAAVLAVTISLSGIGQQPFDSRELMGTLAPRDAALQSENFAAQGLSGTVSLLPGEPSGYDLVFDLQSKTRLSVSASYDPSVMDVQGYRGVGPESAAVTSRPGEIAFVSDGEQHLKLHLVPGTGGQVRIRVNGPEGTLQDLAISVPPEK